MATDIEAATARYTAAREKFRALRDAGAIERHDVGVKGPTYAPAAGLMGDERMDAEDAISDLVSAKRAWHAALDAENNLGAALRTGIHPWDPTLEWEWEKWRDRAFALLDRLRITTQDYEVERDCGGDRNVYLNLDEVVVNYNLREGRGRYNDLQLLMKRKSPGRVTIKRQHGDIMIRTARVTQRWKETDEDFFAAVLVELARAMHEDDGLVVTVKEAIGAD